MATKAHITKWKKREFSYSQITLFEYSKEDWFNKYILDLPNPSSPAMEFGKRFAKANEDRKPLAPVTLHAEVEYPLKAKLGKITLIGYADTYQPALHLVDHKTGSKVWDQKRVDNHRQFDFYLLILLLSEKVTPDHVQCAIEWVPTREAGDFSIEFAHNPPKVHHFKTKRTTAQVLQYGAYIQKTFKEMEAYAKERLTNNLSQV